MAYGEHGSNFFSDPLFLTRRIVFGSPGYLTFDSYNTTTIRFPSWLGQHVIKHASIVVGEAEIHP